jgi:hypothetical protein
MTKLSPRTQQLVKKLFPAAKQVDVTRWLTNECGQNLPFHKNTDEYGLERIRFAALKISHGDALKLLEAIELAKRDWRDLLMWAGCGYSLSAHEEWVKSILEDFK